MQPLAVPPPSTSGATLKPPPIEPLKRLDDALMALLRRRKTEAGIMPGLPFH